MEKLEWPGGRSAEPDEVLLAFLDGLPKTIRSAILFGCCFGITTS
jgi:hypothetical protein